MIFCYLLPAGLQKLAAMLRQALTTRRCALTTITWAVPGLEDLLSSEGPSAMPFGPNHLGVGELSSSKGFYVYCSHPNHGKARPSV